MQRTAEVACVYVRAHINVCVRARSHQDVETAHLKLLMHMTRQHWIAPHEISTSERTDIAKKKSKSSYPCLKDQKKFLLHLYSKMDFCSGICVRVCLGVSVSTSFQMRCPSAYQPAGSLGTAHHFAVKP